MALGGGWPHDPFGRQHRTFRHLKSHAFGGRRMHRCTVPLKIRGIEIRERNKHVGHPLSVHETSNKSLCSVGSKKSSACCLYRAGHNSTLPFLLLCEAKK